MTEAAEKIPPRPSPKSAAPKARGASLSKRASEAANDAGDRILEGVETNPLGVLAAGIAVGLAAGALLPKTRLEGRYLGSLGAALNEGAVTAAKAAGEAGKAELAAIGISKIGANEQVGKLLEGFGAAVRSAGNAARESRRRPGSRSNAADAGSDRTDVIENGEAKSARRKA